MNRLLRADEVAAMLGCSTAAVRWIAQRRLASVRVGRLRRVRPADVQAFVASTPSTWALDGRFSEQVSGRGVPRGVWTGPPSESQVADAGRQTTRPSGPGA
jgi:excisionase family DNA binding protein